MLVMMLMMMLVMMLVVLVVVLVVSGKEVTEKKGGQGREVGFPL